MKGERYNTKTSNFITDALAIAAMGMFLGTVFMVALQYTIREDNMRYNNIYSPISRKDGRRGTWRKSVHPATRAGTVPSKVKLLVVNGTCCKTGKPYNG